MYLSIPEIQSSFPKSDFFEKRIPAVARTCHFVPLPVLNVVAKAFELHQGVHFSCGHCGPMYMEVIEQSEVFFEGEHLRFVSRF